MMKIFKTIQKTLILSTLSLSFTTCVHDDDYKDPPNPSTQDLVATTDISALQAKATTTAQLFTSDEIVEGYVVSSDAGGNIYKNMYIVTADGKAGLQLSINKSSLYNLYPLGKKVYVKLNGLALVKQYNMATIGLMPTSTTYPVDQITPGLLGEHIILGKEEKNEESLVVKTNSSGSPLTLADLDDSYLNTLVEISGVEFENARETFVRGTPPANTDNKFANSDVIARVSQYAGFGGYIAPKGIGTVRGIYTKYNSVKQFLLRDINDVKTFIIPEPPVYSETFNGVTNASGNLVSATVRPKIGVAMNFDSGTPVTYTDPTGRSDVRLLSGNACVWFPTSTTTDASLVIDNLPTSGLTNLTLQYSFNAGLYNEGEISNANKLIVKCNGIPVTIPNIPMDNKNSKNTFITVEIKIPNGTTKIEFLGTTINNPYGMRLDDIKIVK